jgi:hypothetical protein
VLCAKGDAGRPESGQNLLAHAQCTTLRTRFGELANRFRRLDRIKVGPAAIAPLTRCTFDFYAARVAKNGCCLRLQFRSDMHGYDNPGMPRVKGIGRPVILCGSPLGGVAFAGPRMRHGADQRPDISACSGSKHCGEPGRLGQYENPCADNRADHRANRDAFACSLRRVLGAGVGVVVAARLDPCVLAARGDIKSVTSSSTNPPANRRWAAASALGKV